MVVHTLWCCVYLRIEARDGGTHVMVLCLVADRGS